jgi:hypothetical protein
LLATIIEAHILHGNSAGIDPLSVSWRRCMDMNDRALRDIVVGLGDAANGYVRQTGFDITAASEVMGIVAVSRDLADLRARLGAITVAQTYEGEPVTADQLRAAGAMTVLLKDALKPNLVQTLEGQPALIHCGPFANIAHGNNSLVADRVALKLGDYVLTESGFGSDMGMEKFFDIVCRFGKLTPSAAVLVTTVRAIELRELLFEQARHAPAIFRVEPVVWIAERMHIALTAVDVPLRDVEHRHGFRDVDVARRPEFDLRVSRTVQQQRHPADLEIETDKRPDVGIAQLKHEARLRLDEVRVLIAFADMVRGNETAPDCARDVVQVGRARDHLQLGDRWSSDERECGSNGK